MKRFLCIAGMLALTTACSVSPTQSSTTSTTSTIPLSVHFIDVGQGDSLYIKTPNGDDIIIDGGNKSKGDDVVNYLKKQKVDDIEVLISTHPDADHIGGLDEVVKAFTVESVYAPKVSHTTQAYKDFLLAVKAQKLSIKTAAAGVTLPLKDVKASFVGPVNKYGSDDLNDWSAVLRLTYNKNSFLFVGDAEKQSETDMINSNQPLQADVLKVSHHGAKNGSGAAFLKAVKPMYAVISVGKNSFGHPTSEVLSRLKSIGATVYRTDQKGTVVISSNGSQLTVKTQR